MDNEENKNPDAKETDKDGKESSNAPLAKGKVKEKKKRKGSDSGDETQLFRVALRVQTMINVEAKSIKNVFEIVRAKNLGEVLTRDDISILGN